MFYQSCANQLAIISLYYKIINLLCCSIVVPVITVPPTDLTVVSPDSATFNCTATAKPRAVIQWTIINNGMVLTGTMGKFTITDTAEGDCIITNPPSECVITSILDITDNIPNDNGVYVCTAINGAGNNTASVSLTVNGKYSSHRTTYVAMYLFSVYGTYIADSSYNFLLSFLY